MELTGHHLRYQLKDPFGISRMTRNTVDALVVEIDHEGISGWGEATDNPYYKSDIADLKKALEGITGIFSEKLLPPKVFYEQRLNKLNCHPFLLSAIDRAYWDFFTRKKEQNVLQLMNWTWQNKGIPLSSYTIGLDKREKMAQKIQSMKWPLYKIKVNGEQTLELLRYLRAFTDAPFMIDANGSLSMLQIEQLIEHSEELQLQLIEQPLAQGKDHLLRPFHDQRKVFLAVDESIRETTDLDRLRPYYHVANFKLMKNGGFTPCLQMIQKAKTLGYKAMMGCMTASSISIGAITPFLPILDFVDMDGALLLSEDIASGVVFENGRCLQPQGCGFGFTVDMELLNKHRLT